MDSDAAGSRRLYFIGTNNLEAGRLGGRRVIEKLGGKGNVVFFTIAGQPNTEERLKGFKDVFATQPDIKIVDVVDIKGDARDAFDKTQELMALTGPKKIDAFVCLESASGKPVADAVKRASVADRLVVAWDVDQDTLDAIKAGTIDATIAQKPFTMGYVGLKALDEVYPRSAQAAQQGLQRGLLFAVPGVCGYRHLAGGQEQRGCVHCGGGGKSEVGCLQRSCGSFTGSSWRSSLSAPPQSVAAALSVTPAPAAALEIETGLALHALFQGGRDGAGQPWIHVQRHEVETDVGLAQANRAEPHRMPFVLWKRRRHAAGQGVDRSRVSLHGKALGMRLENALQCSEDRVKAGWHHAQSSTAPVVN